MSSRTQALVAAGVLALSSAAPTTVLAATGGDDEGPGEQIALDDPALDPDAVTGQDEAIPDDPDPAGESDSEADPGVSDSADANLPASDAKSPVDQSGDPAPTVSPRDVAKSESTSMLAPPAVTSPGGSVPDATAPTVAAPVAAKPAAPSASAPRVMGERRRHLATEVRVRHSAEMRSWLAGARVMRSVEPTAKQGASGMSSVQTYVAQPVVARSVAPAKVARRAGPGDRVHVVFAGESLWSIANDVLGGRATVAQVAREVNRLWELNRARIGTGDRDLLPVGARLVLK